MKKIELFTVAFEIAKLDGHDLLTNEIGKHDVFRGLRVLEYGNFYKVFLTFERCTTVIPTRHGSRTFTILHEESTYEINEGYVAHFINSQPIGQKLYLLYEIKHY